MRPNPLHLLVIALVLCLLLPVPAAAHQGGVYTDPSVFPTNVGHSPYAPQPRYHNPIAYEGSREAAAIIDIAMEAAREYMKKAYTENITEQMVIDEIVRVILENDADPYVSAFWRAEPDPDPSAGLIVASGNASAIPHGDYSDDDWNPVLPGEVVVVDIGARYNGRCSDETRTFFMGEPTPKMREVYDIVLEAHDLAAAEVALFTPAKDIDKAGRDYIEEHGYGDYFTHSIGHGVGYYIHEAPYITQQEVLGEELLDPWVVITVEPGIYLQNETLGDGDIFGIRIEDDYGVPLLVAAEKFTHFPTDIEDVIIHPPKEDPDGDESYFDEHPEVLIGLSALVFLAVPVVTYIFGKMKGGKRESYETAELYGMDDSE